MHRRCGPAAVRTLGKFGVLELDIVCQSESGALLSVVLVRVGVAENTRFWCSDATTCMHAADSSETKKKAKKEPAGI